MVTTTLDIQGMTCGGCVNSVKRALALPGVNETVVSLEKGQATVDFDPARISSDQLKTAVREAGYDVQG